jgi:glutamate racemase
LLPLIPGAHYVYLGDTARLPYGSKSRATIARYAVDSVRFLLGHGAETLVIACNTATALAFPEILSVAENTPVVGVIEPGTQAAQAAALAGGNPHVLVLATAATVESHAYERALSRLGLQATQKACPLLVPLIEEGWVDHPVTRDVLRIYLCEALDTCSPGVVILGCTHYPLIAPLVSKTLLELGSNAQVIDSARATALVVSHGVRNRIDAKPSWPDEDAKKVVFEIGRDSSPGVTGAESMRALENAEKVVSEIGRDFSPGITGTESMRALAPETLSSQDPRFFAASNASFECYATDSTEKFARLGSQFLGQPIPQVKLLDLGG